MVSGHLEVRVHARGTFASANVQANVKVYPQSLSAEDPGVFFVGPTALATCSITTTAPATVPGLLTSPFAGTQLTSAVKVVLEFVQGATAASAAQTFSISADITARP